MFGNDENSLEIGTKLWRRGKNSYATTVPQNILMLKNAPVDNCEVKWSINDDGQVVATFVERGDDE
jgi:hypothetical protein